MRAMKGRATTVSKPPRVVRLRDYASSDAFELGDHVGQVGGIEIWTARREAMPRNYHAFHLTDPYHITLLAYDRAKNTYAGKLDLYLTAVDERRSGHLSNDYCLEDLDVFHDELGIERLRALVVGSSAVGKAYRARGLGVGLYVAAGAIALKENMAIVADACTYEGSTSEMALRVWKSRAFRHQMIVGETGLVAVHKGRR